MNVFFLRRRKLGRTSCREISRFSQHIDKVVRNDKPFPTDTSTVIRWGTTSNVPAGVPVINTAEAIHQVGDKAGFRHTLMNHYDDTETLLCPYTYFEDTIEQWLERVWESSLVVRPHVHAQGKHVYLVNNEAELNHATSKCGLGWYASEYINKVAEYRVMFVQGRVAWVAKKTPGNPNAVAWNVALGGRFDNVSWGNWPLKAIRISREAFLLSSLDFGAVDVMVDEDGNAYVLEINSAPSQTSPYRQECLAKCLDYLIVNGKARISVMEEKGNYRKFIHPALSEEVIVP